MEKQRGRPPLPDEERKGYMFRLRMTHEERALLDRAAKKDGKDTSAWARATLMAKAKKVLASDG
jgi:uncharacterized protein (DUF1778 family)